MPRSKRKKSKKKRKARPYKLDAHSRARHRYRKRRHKSSKVHGHKKHAHTEAQYTNFLLKAMLKTMNSTDEEPYNYHPRHHTKDPEYEFSTKRMKEFKRGFPAPDVSFLRPQGKEPPHRGTFYEWVHTYRHPHEGN